MKFKDLKELVDLISKFPEEIQDKIILSINIRNKSDIKEEDNEQIIPEFGQLIELSNISLLQESTFAPKLLFNGWIDDRK